MNPWDARYMPYIQWIMYMISLNSVLLGVFLVDYHINGLVQDNSVASAWAMKILQSYTKLLTH